MGSRCYRSDLWFGLLDTNLLRWRNNVAQSCYRSIFIDILSQTSIQSRFPVLIVSRRDLLVLTAHINGLVQEKRNYNALAMELRLSCTNPSISNPASATLIAHLTLWEWIISKKNRNKPYFLWFVKTDDFWLFDTHDSLNWNMYFKKSSWITNNITLQAVYVTRVTCYRVGLLIYAACISSYIPDNGSQNQTQSASIT